jgi:cytochrome P450
LRAEGKLVKEDILGRIILARERHTRESLHAKQLFTEATDLIVGGTDTTIATICILFANILRSPDHLKRAIAEIDACLPPLDGDEASCALPGLEEKLDFVHAVIRESCRRNPVAAFNMPRTVPVGGGEIDGYAVPSGVSSTLSRHAHNSVTC